MKENIFKNPETKVRSFFSLGKQLLENSYQLWTNKLYNSYIMPIIA